MTRSHRRGFDRLYVANTDNRDKLGAIDDVSPLYVEAADRELHSCDSRLSDPPAATALRDRARDYLLTKKITTDEWLSDPSTQWYVSDEMPGDTIAVYTLLQTPSTAEFPEGTKDILMTVFGSKDGPVIGATKVNLYAADASAAPPLAPGARPASANRAPAGASVPAAVAGAADR